MPMMLADVPEATAEAAKFTVPPDIHVDDYIFQYLLNQQRDVDRVKARALVSEYYFRDGDDSASHLDSLIRHHHPAADLRRLSVMEFASNFGCVSRHLRKLGDRYDLTACDLHPAAITFLRDRLDVPAVLATIDPGAFDPGGKFDVVFALYFFSHTSPRTFGAWIEALHAALAEGGLLIFATHGRASYEDEHCPTLDPAGYWFLPDSERRHLPTDDYGAMVPTPFYVTACIGRCPGAAVVAFQEAAWWGKQDLFVVRKVRTNFRPEPVPTPPSPDPELERLRAQTVHLAEEVLREREGAQALSDAIATIRRSTSWRLTAPLRQIARLLKAG